MLIALANAEFGPTAALTAPDDLMSLKEDERLVVEFVDCEMLFTVTGKARGALHLGCYISPWEYIFWRCERRGTEWLLTTHDAGVITRLSRFYGNRPAA